MCSKQPDGDARALLMERLGVVFKEEAYLVTALTHSSYTMEKEEPRVCCNERLEFLGDAFFDAIIGEELYRRLPDEEEGMLTKMRALVVCEESLYEQSLALHLGEALRLGRGEENSGGRNRRSILADGVEALIGAIYLDQGYEVAKATVLRLFKERIEEAVAGHIVSDYKSTLQELLQKEGPVEIRYLITGEEGPDHDKRFYAQVLAEGKVLGRGVGANKKEAEQQAAKDALQSR